MPIRKFERQDLPAIIELVSATGVFKECEVEVARELLEIIMEEPDQKDYVAYTYLTETGTVLGYYCYGPTPLTASTYDLYWIAVHPSQQGNGIGYQLLQHCENLIRSCSGSLIMVETSSLPKYDATRKFYLRNRYNEAAHVRDYYAPGDDLVVYSKHIQEV
jgi:ribosomal protein S18 acetylase RimI-like enzyme